MRTCGHPLAVLATLALATAGIWIAPPQASAAVTPPAFGNCGKAAADRAWKSSDMPELIRKQLDSEPFSDPTFSPQDVFFLRHSACRDLNGDGACSRTP
jgi:hypothetical protein